MKFFPYLFLLVLLQGCGESFQTIDPKNFNAQIAGRTDISSPEALIRLYYQPADGGADLKIQTEEPGHDQYKITLVHDHLQDDSVEAEKIVLFAQRNGQTWTVTEIRESWKCRSGRGHTSWNAEPCS